jgi:hypothetical protein
MRHSVKCFPQVNKRDAQASEPHLRLIYQTFQNDKVGSCPIRLPKSSLVLEQLNRAAQSPGYDLMETPGED